MSVIILLIIMVMLGEAGRIRHEKHRAGDQPMSDQPDDDNGKPFVFVTISEINIDSGANPAKRYIELLAQRNPYNPPQNHISLFRGWRLLMIRGSTMEIVMSVNLANHVSGADGPYIVIGDGSVPNVDIRLESERTEISFSPATFPEMDSTPFAIVVVGAMDIVSSEMLSLPTVNGALQPLPLASDEIRKQLVFELAWDMVVVGRRASTNQCDYFSAFFPQFSFSDSKGLRYLLRDRDSATSSVNDYSLNYCCKDPTPYSPECFKLGHPSPGLNNDCTGIHFVLEQQLNNVASSRQSSVFIDQNEEFCRANFPGVEPYRYSLVHDHDYAQAVARVMQREQCELPGEPMDVDALPGSNDRRVVPSPSNDEPRKYLPKFNKEQFKQCEKYFSNPKDLLHPHYSSWLQVAHQPDSCLISCQICRLYFQSGWRPDEKHKSYIQTRGFFSKSIYVNRKAVNDHMKDEVHAEALFFFVMLEQATSRSEQIEIESKQREREIKRLRPTMNEVCLGYTELRARVSFQCHGQFMNGAHRLGVNVGFKHRNEKSLKKLSVVLSSCFHKRLLEHLVKEKNYFSLICDGTTNRQIPYLVCLIQTLENGKPVVYFWGLLVITTGESGYNMVEDLKIRVSQDNDIVPGFEQYFKTYIIASVSDSASNMAGVRNSFYTHLSLYVGRKLALVKCGAHKLQRAILHAVDFPTDLPTVGVQDRDRKRYFKTFTSINNRFYTFYMSRGSKRFQEFVELAEELEIPAYRINYFFDVRWAASHKRCMETMYKNYDALRADLSRITSDPQFEQSAKTKANELYNHLIDKTFPVVVAEFVDFLTVFEMMSLRFQSKGGILIGNVEIIRDGYLDFERLKNEPGSYLRGFLKKCSCQDTCSKETCTLEDYDRCAEVMKDDSQKLKSRTDGQHTIKLSEFRTQLYENIQNQIVEYFQPEQLEAFEVFNPKNFVTVCQSSSNAAVHNCDDLSSCYTSLPTIVPNRVPKSVEDNIRIVCEFYGLTNVQQMIADWKHALSVIVTDRRMQLARYNDPARFWPDQLKRPDAPFSESLKNLLQRILVTSFTSADAERAFSMVSNIKTQDRQNMSPKTLQDLVRIAFNGPDELSEDSLYEYTKEFVKITSRVDDPSAIGGQEPTPDAFKSFFPRSELF